MGELYAGTRVKSKFDIIEEIRIEILSQQLF
jgi:hypothetical protein